MEADSHISEGSYPFSLRTQQSDIYGCSGKGIVLCAELLDIQGLLRQITYF